MNLGLKKISNRWTVIHIDALNSYLGGTISAILLCQITLVLFSSFEELDLKFGLIKEKEIVYSMH
jgi:hypothetical protein